MDSLKGSRVSLWLSCVCGSVYWGCYLPSSKQTVYLATRWSISSLNINFVVSETLQTVSPPRGSQQSQNCWSGQRKCQYSLWFTESVVRKHNTFTPGAAGGNETDKYSLEHQERFHRTNKTSRGLEHFSHLPNNVEENTFLFDRRRGFGHFLPNQWDFGSRAAFSEVTWSHWEVGAGGQNTQQCFIHHWRTRSNSPVSNNWLLDDEGVFSGPNLNGWDPAHFFRINNITTHNWSSDTRSLWYPLGNTHCSLDTAKIRRWNFYPIAMSTPNLDNKLIVLFNVYLYQK